MAIVPFFSLKEQLKELEPKLTPLIAQVLSEGQFIGGKYVEKFEQDFAEYLGVKNCVTCGNGTDALEIALRVLGVGVGDEVIVPALSWISTALAVVNVGATAIFVDVKPTGFSIDPDLIENSISPRTKVIVPVHLYGYPAEMDEINSIARKYGIYVLEDAAQAHGSEYKGVKAGNLGDIATFSFYPTKNLGCFGDGGAIVTNNTEWADKARVIANYGDPNRGLLGRNSRLDSLQAAILSLKLEYLDRWNGARIEMATLYKQVLQDIENIDFISNSDDHISNQHIFPIFSAERDNILFKLDKHGIGYGCHYQYTLPQFFQSDSQYPISQRACQSELSLPIYPTLDLVQVEEVLRKFRI